MFEITDRVDHSSVLGRNRNTMLPAARGRSCNPAERKVDGFRGAAGEDHFLREASHQRGDLFSSPLHRRLRPPSELMLAAGGVAVRLREVRKHGVDHARIDLRRRMIVEVYQPSLRHHTISDRVMELNARSMFACTFVRGDLIVHVLNTPQLSGPSDRHCAMTGRVPSRALMIAETGISS